MEGDVGAFLSKETVSAIFRFMAIGFVIARFEGLW